MYPYPPPEHTPEDYLTQFQRLLPRGRVWHRGWGWLQDADLLTLMPTWSRLQSSINTLIANIFPCSTTDLLPEWEETLGLPDPCIGPLATVQERQAAVCAKFVGRGGQSVAYFIRLANSLGFDARIKQFSPFRVGINHAGDPLYDNAWAFAWTIIVAPTLIIYFRTGVSTAGEPLRAWGNKILECIIAENAPAHTYPIFSYGLLESLWDVIDLGVASLWDNGTSIWDEGVIINA